MTKTILVTGATGKQGGATINALLEAEADCTILAVTRNAKSPGALSLARKSERIKVIEGNLEKPEDLFQKAKAVAGGVWGVFSIQAIMGNGQSSESEERQGKALIDAALKHDVKFFVYSSVDRGGDASIDNPTDIPHFISKHNIEHHLYNATNPAISTHQMQWTVLRPVAFFDNLTPDFLGKAFATWFETCLKGKKLQFIAASDIGRFAAKAFMNPEEYAGRRITLAGDELSWSEFEGVFREVVGKDVPTTFRWLAGLMLWMVKEVGLMFRWFGTHGYGGDIEAVRRELPGVKNFRTWLETESGFVKK